MADEKTYPTARSSTDGKNGLSARSSTNKKDSLSATSSTDGKIGPSARSSTDGKTGLSANWKEEFLEELHEIRRKGKEDNLTDEEIDELFYQSPWFQPSPLQNAVNTTLRVRY